MSGLKSNFAVKSKYESFYTGGKIQLSADGVYMFCGCGNKVNCFEIATGRVHSSIGETEDEVITSFSLTPSDQYLVLATQNLLLRQWNWKEKVLVRTWKAIHFAPIMSMAFDSTSTLLATGGADSTVKLWDIEKQYCTHNLKGHQGVVSIVAFHPDISRLLLYSAGDDYKVRVWNLATSSCITQVAAHFSNVTAIVFSADGSQIFSSGRDGIVAVWDASKHKVTKTIPVFESLESLVLVPEGADYPDISVSGGDVHFVTAGNKGILRVWNSATARCVYQTKEVHTKHPDSPATDDQSTETAQNIVQMLHSPALNSVAVVTYDQNISLIGVDKLRLQKQFAGNIEEILDVKYFGAEEKFVLVATNSRHIKLFELDTWDCEILYGHTDIVLCIDVLRKANRFISSGKDNTVRLWELDPANKQVSCLAIGQGHTHSVGALAFARMKPTYFVSGSEDCTLKLWNIPSDLDPKVTVKVNAAVTEKAHEKTISCVEVAPNDLFVATGSMDKTAKVWKASDLSLLGVLRGHRRGIWHVQFSPVDQILATASGDSTVKLWGLTDFTCVMTFEGHSTAVLRVSFINRGMQLLSSSTDGLVKLWTIKTSECVKTLDEHEDKIWSLTVSKTGDSFITGAADSSLIVWKDVTDTEQNEARQKQEQIILQEQELSNLIQQKKYLKAIGLAITLEQPFKVLNIMKEILSDVDGDEKLYRTLEKLRQDQVDALLRFASQWNTNSRHCHEAQFVLAAILRMHTPADLAALGNIKSSIEGLLPYTDRHFQRLSRLLQQSMFLEYTWHCMKNVATDGSLPTTSVAMETNVIEQFSAVQGHTDSESSSESEEEIDSRKMVTEKKAHPLNKGDRTLKTEKVDVSGEKLFILDSVSTQKEMEQDESDESSENEENSQSMKTPKLNLFKACSDGKLLETDKEVKKAKNKRSKKQTNEKMKKKRKMTDTYTVVKSKPEKDDNENFYLDTVPTQRHRADKKVKNDVTVKKQKKDKSNERKADKVKRVEEVKVKTSKSLAGPSKLRTNQKKLKKPRQVSRYFKKQSTAGTRK